MNEAGENLWAFGPQPIFDADEMLEILMRSADIMLTLASDMTVQSVFTNSNLQSTAVLEGWVGLEFHGTLSFESQTKFETRIAKFMKSNDRTCVLELNHTIDDEIQISFEYQVFKTRSDGSLFLLGRDLSDIVILQQKLIQAQSDLRRDDRPSLNTDRCLQVLMEASDHAVAFVSSDSDAIIKMNRNAENMLRLSSNIFEQPSFEDQFEPSRDKINMSSQGIKKMFPTSRIIKRTGMNVLIKGQEILSASDKIIMYQITPASEQQQGQNSTLPHPPSEASQLVGTASLKAIVSQTTDIIERKCISAALYLANNNRSIAADMLGLSRQSLYVKMRKHGLHDVQDTE